jgi:hypothetical protein
MAQTQATTTTTTETNGTTTAANGKGKRDPKPLTAADAIVRISKMLEQLTPLDQKRVLAFINVSNETA